MTIHNPTENLIVVNLPANELHIADELNAINQNIDANPDCDVIIDFTNVEAMTSSSLSNLLILHNILTERGHRLILCNVSVITRCVFNVAGLQETFDFAPNMPKAVAAAQSPK